MLKKLKAVAKKRERYVSPKIATNIVAPLTTLMGY